MINDLIIRLMTEAASVADEKGLCDAGSSTIRQTRAWRLLGVRPVS